ncbi:ribonuclease H-like domain-containing protein [Tanacetum coccineum]
MHFFMAILQRQFTCISHQDLLIQLILIMFSFCKSRFMPLSRPPELGFNDFLAILFNQVSITVKPTRLFSSFTRSQTRLTTVCGLYILIASSTSLLQRIISLLHVEFAMTDLGPLNYFLSKSVMRSPVTDPTLYRSLAGALQYLTFTRPDLSYAVQQLCLYMHDPREPHLNAMKRVLRYLRGTTNLGLQLFWSTTSQLIAYSVADWAGCPATRWSTSGYYVFLGDNLLTWSSKRQDTLSCSSSEAEYLEVVNDVADTSWICNLLRKLHTSFFTSTLVYCDNVSAVYMSANPVQHQRTKHIEIDIHFVRDKVAAGHVQVLHVPSRFQDADIFIKGLTYPLFTDFKSSLSVRKSPAPTAGAY